jgi:hypothetical protein
VLKVAGTTVVLMTIGALLYATGSLCADRRSPALPSDVHR